MLGQAWFYTDLVRREGDRHKGPDQFAAVSTVDDLFPCIVAGIETALSRGNHELLNDCIGSLGFFMILTSRYKEGLAIHERLAQAATEAGNRPLLARALLGMCISLYGLGEYRRAMEFNGRALLLLDEKREIQVVRAALSQKAAITSRLGDLQQAEDSTRQRLRISRQLGDERDAAGALNDLGSYASEKGFFEEARNYFLEALEINQRVGNHYWAAINMGNLGIIEARSGQYEEAARQFLASLEIHRRLGSHEYIAIGLGNLALLRIEQGRFTDGLQLANESLQFNRKIGNDRNEANILRIIGSCQLNQGLFEESEASFSQALVKAKAIENPPAIADGFHGMGCATMALRRYSEAAKYHEDARAIYRKIDRQWNIALTSGCLSLAYLELGQVSAAYHALEESLRISREVGTPELSLRLLVATGQLLVKCRQDYSGGLVLAGAMRQRAELSILFDPESLEKWQRSQATALAALTPERAALLQAEAGSLTLAGLTEYADRALCNLQQELDGELSESAPADHPPVDAVAETAEHDAGRDAHA